MTANTKIEWADHTFNPWIGCTKVSPGCDHCYAEAWDRRFAVSGNAMRWGAGKTRTRTSALNWRQPLKWDGRSQMAFASWQTFRAKSGMTDAELVAQGFIAPRRPRVFCASLADVFDNEAPPEWRTDLFRLIERTPHLDWLLLTKRIGNAEEMMFHARGGHLPLLPNVWLGATIVNQAEADRDIPKLLATPAAKRFLSIEPLLDPVGIWKYTQPHCERHPGKLDADGTCDVCEGRGLWSLNDGPLTEDEKAPIRPGIDWVIVGGESGPHARPMHPDWVRALRNECVLAGVPFHFKQWGEHAYEYDRDRDDPDYRQCDRMARLPGRWINLAGGHGFNGERVHYAQRIGKKAAGRLLDGRTWDEAPSDLAPKAPEQGALL